MNFYIVFLFLVQKSPSQRIHHMEKQLEQRHRTVSSCKIAHKTFEVLPLYPQLPLDCDVLISPKEEAGERDDGVA